MPAVRSQGASTVEPCHVERVAENRREPAEHDRQPTPALGALGPAGCGPVGEVACR
ncbi:MAG TPA: hypothetical protein VH572_09560 [Gaiella sp.]|jgi:hypothetical protein